MVNSRAGEVDNEPMTSAGSQAPLRVDNAKFRTVALFTALPAAVCLTVVEVVGVLRGHPGSWARLATYSVIALAAGIQLLGRRRTEPVLLIIGVSLGLLSLLGDEMLSSFDDGSMGAVLILILIVYVTTRQSQTLRPLIVASGLTAGYTLAAVIIDSPPTSQAVGLLLIGIPGQMLVVWITWSLINTLGEATARQAAMARIQHALTTCSEALLTGKDEKPLSAALHALLDATGADYCYVDVNRVGPDGRITWEIVADAVGADVPPGPGLFDGGDYNQLEEVLEALSRGTPARVSAKDLPMPLRGRYEAEGIKSELMAPIMIRGEWIGTLGYSDFWRDDAWTEVEVQGLKRAADMVSAYWERETAREGLEELAQAKDRFIATVSHELRTPLAAVVGFSGELAEAIETYSREEIAEMVGLISSQSLEVSHLVEDLLTAERAASGNLTIKADAIDLLEETRSVAESLRAGFTLSPESSPARVWADTLRTRQIVRNLLTNALRYGGPQVRIEVTTRDRLAVLLVTDDGPGVRGIDAERIFDPYYRSTSGDSRPDSVGLGLAVARQLARLMGGDIVYMRRKDWTIFELTLPMMSESAPVIPA
jgi:signal transduction histidine kinase